MFSCVSDHWPLVYINTGGNSADVTERPQILSRSSTGSRGRSSVFVTRGVKRCVRVQYGVKPCAVCVRSVPRWTSTCVRSQPATTRELLAQDTLSPGKNRSVVIDRWVVYISITLLHIKRGERRSRTVLGSRVDYRDTGLDSAAGQPRCSLIGNTSIVFNCMLPRFYLFIYIYFFY